MQTGWLWGLKPLLFPNLMKGSPQHYLTVNIKMALAIFPITYATLNVFAAVMSYKML